MPNPQPPLQMRREVDAQIAIILARLDAQDRLLVGLKAQNDCILEGINGTFQTKGMAGRVRDLEDWRARVDATLSRLVWAVLVPLTLTVLLATAGFLWALVTHNIEIILH